MSIPHRLTADRLREIVDYDPETGFFVWRHESRSGFHGSVLMHRQGERAGTPRKSDGRTVIRIGARTYLSYRLAWLWMTGSWPLLEIDHIDGDPTNDSFSNLRDASRRANQQNIRKAKRDKRSSEFLGVFANRPSYKKPWRSAIYAGGRQISLGSFDTEEEAHAAYVSAKRRMHEGCTL
ncbi:HNH endonuclease [Pseudomonas viridiflava]|uniref:HNH endonuclease n=1 Tax=Pseudomonas viridiflava TaxID=33069 RepID=UPI001C2CE1EF|nr:HNH endonuclease [Pseudomonas viridiflava]MBV1814509.1 HNH endonuclease [Pseudomonas viridiflava]